MTPDAASRPAAGPDDLAYAAVLRAAAGDATLRKTERTRARLLASLAGQLMDGVERGELRVAGVTAGAGLAHGTFYRYFPDIRAATEALVEEFAGFVRTGLAGARDGQTGSRERVRGATLLYVRLFRANAGLMRCLIALGRESDAFSRAYQRLNREWNLRMAAAIARRRAAAAGGLPQPAEHFLPAAYALGGMVDEFLTQLYLRHDPALAALHDDEAAVAELLAELWCLGADGVAALRPAAP
ncbi:hypothetical protein SAMN06265365_10466 [Tistlia consotensis]|uniref:Transcriptional regulator, TetR family n=1 Tax=Tistlia consotensis USBA 355 TaxID=560819 RepID=A0A1Y6CIB8_9PROT|nr:TetR/AcrR family transcriptional regulator [Tistlia consotensis]SMF57123.1 hypothetical protein SAMN05428998_12167 [Tistlia consotensis USBA 355]SNR45410.1 hypothetical protein SAMN06265365_10466 [Tistlia consotensis]